MRDVFAQAPYYQAMSMPTQPAPINTRTDITPGPGALYNPSPANSEAISRDDEGHMTVTSLIDVKRDTTSAHLEDSQFAFLYRATLAAEHQAQLKGTDKKTSERFGKLSVLTLPLANHFLRTMSFSNGSRTNNTPMVEHFTDIKRTLLQGQTGTAPSQAQLDDFQLPESVVDDMLMPSEAGEANPMPSVTRLNLRYGTAESVLANISALGGICSQPNKLRTASTEGPGNFTAEGGDTSAVIGWRGNVDLRDVWNLNYTRENPINHSRHLYLVLKRTYRKAATLKGVDILKTDQKDWSALQFVPVAGDFTKDHVPAVHSVYLGYGGAIEWGKVIYVGLAMQQVEKRTFSQAVHDAGAGIDTFYTSQPLPGTPNQLSLTNMLSAARSLNLFITLADPSLQSYYVPVHA